MERTVFAVMDCGVVPARRCVKMNRTPKVFYLTFGIFRLSKSWEIQPMAFFILPNIGKIVFR